MWAAVSSTFPTDRVTSGRVQILSVAPRRALIFRMQSDGAIGNIPDLADARLVRGMTAGDSAALGTFYDRWSGKVYAIAVSIVGVAADAEEIVQETFLQAWNQAERFDGTRGRPAAWILNIARSRSLDRLKAIKRRREDVTDSFDASVPSESTDPGEAIDSTNRSEAIKLAMEKLPEEQRRAVEMAYYGGLSQTEIAESTGQPLGTVKTRIRLAMQKLRDQLAPVHEAHA